MTSATRLVWQFVQAHPRHVTEGQAAIAAAVGVSEKTVARAMRALEDAGKVKRYRRGRLGGGRKGDVIVVNDTKQRRFFVDSKQAKVRKPSALWMGLIREFVEPWQNARGRGLSIDNRRRTLGQWATVTQREPRPEIRAIMIKKYLTSTDRFLRDKDYPLGLLLVRFGEFHSAALREASATASRLRALQTADMGETEPQQATGTDGGARERFARLLALRSAR